MSRDRLDGQGHLRLPYGVKDVLGPELRLRRWVEARLEELFEEEGCTPIQTPVFEHYEVFARGATPQSLRQAYRFTDGGEDLVLRPDPTSAVARVVATALREEPPPLKLGYVCPVFRREQPHGGQFREFHQAGIEWIGAAGVEADAEIVQLALRCADRLGIPGARVQLGSVALARGLFAGRLDGPGLRRLLEALDHRSRPAVEAMAREGVCDPETTDRALRLLGAKGGPETFEELAPLADHPAAARALEQLRSLWTRLPPERVLLDPCAVRGGEYYTGPLFRLYAPGQGFELGRGGRYDRLLARFGRDLPAVGFALEVERLMPLVSRPDPSR